MFFEDLKPIITKRDPHELAMDLKQSIKQIIETIPDVEYEIEDDVLPDKRDTKLYDYYKSIKVYVKVPIYSTKKTKEFEAYINTPNSLDVIYMLGYPKYLQSQLIDTFLGNAVSKNLGFLGHVVILDDRVEFSRTSLPLYEVYKQVLEEGEEDLFIKHYDDLHDNMKKQIDNINKNKHEYDINKYYKLIYMVKAYFKVFPLWKEYFNTIAEMLYFASRYFRTTHKFEGLMHKRIRFPYITFREEYLLYFLNDMFSVMTDRSNVTMHKKRYDPDQAAFEIIQLETFPSPLAFLSNINRVTLLAKFGGLSRENASPRYRNLHWTHKEVLDPVVTPDRENAGIVLYLANDAKLDKHGRIVKLLKYEYEIINEFREEFGLAPMEVNIHE